MPRQRDISNSSGPPSTRYTPTVSRHGRRYTVWLRRHLTSSANANSVDCDESPCRSCLRSVLGSARHVGSRLETRTSLPYFINHTRRGASHIVVLPEPEHCPTARFQERVRIPVTPHVVLDLVPPPSGVGLWPGSVLGASMPKAAVDKSGHSRAHERQVCPSASTWKRPVNAEPEAQCVNCRAESELARRVAPWRDLHPPTHLSA